MKKKLLGFSVVIIFVIISSFFWFKIPIDSMDISASDVMEISVFDGNTGTSLHITNKDDIIHIVENLNMVTLTREKLSIGYMGYSFKIILYGDDGEELDGWNIFFINTEKTIRKDPFFYEVTEGSIDFSYIQELINKQAN